MTPVCPACGGRLSPWSSAAAVETSLPDPFPLRRCSRCGTARTVGQAPADVYSTGTYLLAPPRVRWLVLPLLNIFARERIRIVQSAAPPPARLLDVGSGRGRFLTAAIRAGYDASGIEPAPDRAAESGARGVPVRTSAIETAGVGAASLDVVTLWHVLEHTEDPRAALVQIRSWLRPGALVIVAVPNLSSVQAHLGGMRWFHLDVPRHRTHFTRDGLLRLLRSCDLEPVGEHHLLLEHNPYGMWQTWVNLVTSRPAYLYNLLKHNAAPSIRDLTPTLAALPIIPFAVLIELLAGLSGRGGTIVVVARRSAELQFAGTSAVGPADGRRS